MKNAVLLLVVLFAVVGDHAIAQCGPSGCPFPQGSFSPILQPRQWQASPQSLQPNQLYVNDNPAVVLTKFYIRAADGHEETALGSGFIAGRDEAKKIAYVLTCAHGYHSQMDVAVFICGEKQGYQARVEDVDAVQDVILLTIADPGIIPVVLSDAEPAIGEKVYACGFAGGRNMLGSWGQFKNYLSPENEREETLIETTCQTVSGCSGGPIFACDGKVLGLITGSGRGTGTTGPCFPRLRKLLGYQYPPAKKPQTKSSVGKTPSNLVDAPPYIPKVEAPLAPIVQIPLASPAIQPITIPVPSVPASISLPTSSPVASGVGLAKVREVATDVAGQVLADQGPALFASLQPIAGGAMTAVLTALGVSCPVAGAGAAVAVWLAKRGAKKLVAGLPQRSQPGTEAAAGPMAFVQGLGGQSLGSSQVRSGSSPIQPVMMPGQEKTETVYVRVPISDPNEEAKRRAERSIAMLDPNAASFFQYRDNLAQSQLNPSKA